MPSDDPGASLLGELPDEITQRWAALAIGFRFQRSMLDHVRDPGANSNFAKANALYPQEKTSDWCRGYLVAALEHAVFWADFTQPLSFSPEHRVIHTFRPAQTLGRATLEAASQAVWILGAKTAREMTRRHLCLIRWDYEERRKSLPLDEKPTMTEADRLLLQRAMPHFEADDLRPNKSYLFVIQHAAAISDLDPQEVEAIWRAASGSAHGRRWPAHVLQHVIPGEEYEPGQHRTFQIADPDAITRVIETASHVSYNGVLRYLHAARVDIDAVREAAIQQVGALLPLVPGVDRDELLRRRPGEF